jgi:hypothetical protein
VPNWVQYSCLLLLLSDMLESQTRDERRENFKDNRVEFDAGTMFRDSGCFPSTT